MYEGKTYFNFSVYTKKYNFLENYLENCDFLRCHRRKCLKLICFLLETNRTETNRMHCYQV
jgi:hypothetical protein